MTLTHIVCPVDFSDASRHAIDQATVVAGYYHSRITALHVLTSSSDIFATATEDAARVDALRPRIAEDFACAASQGIAVDILIEPGHPADVILERAASARAGLIVMGTHGTSRFQHLVLGSVTEKVLRKATCPVLTVPARARATSQLPFTRLLCAVDFSDSSLEAVRAAVSLAEGADATLTLIHVLEWPWEEPPAPSLEELPREQAAALAEFRRYLEKSARTRLESLVPDTMQTPRLRIRIENGKPHREILHAAAEERSDLIVLGVRGRNPVDLALLGSTANQVVRRATCPVMTYRS